MRNLPMIIANKHVAALAVGLSVATFALPSLARPRADHVDHLGAARGAAIEECSREANGEYPWFEDMNRAEAYRACMARHG
jgi:hypothetical protein